MPILNIASVAKARDTVMHRSRVRHELIAVSNTILFSAKRIIFALHSGNVSVAEDSLSILKKKVEELHKGFRAYPYIHEGAYRAAMEEYTEASFFLSFMQKKPMGAVRLVDDAEIYLAGLCDVLGELYRFALSAVAERRFEDAERAHFAAYSLYTELSLGEFTQYLRTKYDQARSVMHKLDELRAQIALRNT